MQLRALGLCLINVFETVWAFMPTKRPRVTAVGAAMRRAGMLDTVSISNAKSVSPVAPFV